MRYVISIVFIGLIFSTPSIAQSEANARVQKACSGGSHENCMAQIRLEEMCVEYRGDAMTAFGFKAARIPIETAANNIIEMETRTPAFPDEPIQSPLVSGDDLIGLLRAAYSGKWVVQQEFAQNAYDRCVSGQRF